MDPDTVPYYTVPASDRYGSQNRFSDPCLACYPLNILWASIIESRYLSNTMMLVKKAIISSPSHPSLLFLKYVSPQFYVHYYQMTHTSPKGQKKFNNIKTLKQLISLKFGEKSTFKMFQKHMQKSIPAFEALTSLLTLCSTPSFFAS